MKKDQLIELAVKLGIYENAEKADNENNLEDIEKELKNYKPEQSKPEGPSAEEFESLKKENKNLSDGIKEEIEKSSKLQKENEDFKSKIESLENDKDQDSPNSENEDSEAVIKSRKLTKENKDLKKKIKDLESVNASKKEISDLEKKLRKANDSKRDEIKKAVQAERANHAKSIENAKK